MRRFSSMVRRAKTRRPSGHLHDAERHDVVGGHAREVPAVEDDLPAARPQQPADGVQRGRLAGAVGADERDDLALVDGQGDALQGVDVAVVGVEVGDLEQRHGQASVRAGSRRLPAASCRRCRRHPPPARRGLAQVGLDDALVALDLGRRALGDALAVVEHRDALGDAHDDAHLVLDEQDGHAALVAQAADERRRLRRLGGVHAGRRLVEQQQARPRGQGAGDLEPSLVAVGQAGGLDVALAAEPHEGEQLLGLASAAVSSSAAGRGCGRSTGSSLRRGAGARPRGRSRARSCPGRAGCSGTSARGPGGRCGRVAARGWAMPSSTMLPSSIW